MLYRHLTPAERRVVYSMNRAGYLQREIARALGRSPSTISRELRRNWDQVSQEYCPHWANLSYWKRRERIYKSYKTSNVPLMNEVVAKLKKRWSPEQIAGRLRYVTHPKNPAKWISYQTIYRYIFRDKMQGGKLWRYLRRGRKWFGKRGAGRHPNTYLKGRVSIEHRPEIVNQQARVGDWEGDTFYGAKRKCCLATVVDRKTLFLAAQKMPDATAPSLNEAIVKALHKVNKALVHTLTVDNGKEFAQFKALEATLETTVYFTHPYSAWERPINENLNGLIRQYLPKKKDFSSMTEDDLECIIQSLNNRPRKKLGYRTPNEAFQEAVIALDM